MTRPQFPLWGVVGALACSCAVDSSIDRPDDTKPRVCDPKVDPFCDNVPPGLCLPFGSCNDPCSDDYSRVDDCENAELPPAPSIERKLGQVSWNDPNTRHYVQSMPHPTTGKMQVLPTLVSVTSDGRLMLDRGPGFSVFRPERLGYDYTLTGGDPYSDRTPLTPVVMGSPVGTQLSLQDSPGVQTLICDPSSDSVDLPAEHGRNPRRCTAQADAAVASVSGDCYDVTLLSMMNNDASYQEIRSTEVTVFVPEAKTPDAGQPWIYPRLLVDDLPPYDEWGPGNDSPDWQPAHDDDERSANDRWVVAMDRVRNTCMPCEVDPSLDDACAPPHFQCLTSGTDEAVCQAQFDACVNAACEPTEPWCAFAMDQHSSTETSWMLDGEPWNGYNCCEAAGCEQLQPDCRWHPWRFFETTLSRDGRLLITNVEGDGLFYSYNEEGPCRADGFRVFKRLSEMPGDSNVNERYDLAKTPAFRNSRGETIPPGEHIRGAYLWLDDTGSNLFFAHLNQSRDIFEGERQGLHPDSDDFPDRGSAKGITVLGSWTQHKMVTLDNALNASGFSGYGGEAWELQLYDGSPTTFRPASTWANFSFENKFAHYDAMRPSLPFDVVWTVAGANQHVAEIAFDDFVDPDALIVAPMNEAIRYRDIDEGYSEVGHTHPEPDDGYVALRAWSRFRKHEYRTEDLRPYYTFKATPQLQNAATGTDSEVPSTLMLRGGARVEPVGQGGVLGKGVYLDGSNDHIGASLGNDMPVADDYYSSLWIEPHRADGTVVETLMVLPDGSWLGMSREQLVGRNPSGVERSIDLTALGLQPQQWFHLAIRATGDSDQRMLRVHINGTPLSSTMVWSDGGFELGSAAPFAAPLWIGHPGPGWTPVDHAVHPPLNGWIDELRVSRLRPDAVADGSYFDELICNHALGTLVTVRVDDEDPKFGVGNTTLDIDETVEALQILGQIAENHGLVPPGEEVADGVEVCEQMLVQSHPERPTDFAEQWPQGDERVCIPRVHRNPHPNPLVAERCARARVLEQHDKPLVADQPRPLFSDTGFCSSCHQDSENEIAGLRSAALDYHASTQRRDDDRRQPLDWPALMFGQHPEGWPWTTVPDLSPAALDDIFDFVERIEP